MGKYSFALKAHVKHSPMFLLANVQIGWSDAPEGNDLSHFSASPPHEWSLAKETPFLLLPCRSSASLWRHDLLTRGRQKNYCTPTYECTTMARLYFLLSLGVLVVVIAAQNPEQCHMYYGGLVFPEGSRRPVEHGLHWSKTQSRVGVTEVIPVRTGL